MTIVPPSNGFATTLNAMIATAAIVDARQWRAAPKDDRPRRRV